MESKIYPKNVTLKPGDLVLRPLEKADEEALVKFFAGLPKESTAFLKNDVRDPTVVKQFISNLDPDRIFALLALDGAGRIVGDATLHMDQVGWRRHVGEVRVVVASEFRKCGLATTLIHELVNQASMHHLKKLEAQILDNQVGALSAFKNLGFVEEARLKDHAMDLEDQLHDLLILTNRVEDLWRKMENMLLTMDIRFSH